MCSKTPGDLPSLRAACPLWYADVLGVRGSWDAFARRRRPCRFRAAALDLGHVSGRTSVPKVQNCIRCNKPVRSCYFHVLGACYISSSSVLDEIWGHRGQKERCVKMLLCSPAPSIFPEVCRILNKMDLMCIEFWNV